MAISHQNKFQVGRAVANSVIYSSLVLVLLRCTLSSALAFACSRMLEYPRLCAALCIELLLVLVLAVVVLVLVRSFFAGCHVHVYARVFSRPAGMSSCEAVVRTGTILGPCHRTSAHTRAQARTRRPGAMDKAAVAQANGFISLNPRAGVGISSAQEPV